MYVLGKLGGGAGLNLAVVVELTLVDQAFGLEPDVDDHVVPGLSDDPSLEDGAGLEVLDIVLKQAVHISGGDFFAERLADQAFHFAFLNTDLVNQVVVDHGFVVDVMLVAPRHAPQRHESCKISCLGASRGRRSVQ